MVLELAKVVLEASELLVVVVVGLALEEVEAFVGEREGSEEEGLDGEGKEPVLGFLTVLVHYVAHDREVDRLHLRLLEGLEALGFQDEAVSLVVAVREDDHHEAHDDLLLLEGRHGAGEDVGSEEVVEELLDHFVDLKLGGGGEAPVLLDLLPELEVGLLEGGHLALVELVELLLVELGHDPEAGAVEEEVELLVVLLRLRVRDVDLRQLRPLLQGLHRLEVLL
mmetsp:Transcript_16301/g.27554  ORF Transcript_16301/g.27554 Transcript_16301/m.27554 type:complete len:224 (+) Transcript_16301:768-1439(+)